VATKKKAKKTVRKTVTTAISARAAALMSIGVAAVYFFSNPKPQNYYDYTFRVAANFLGGRIAFTEPQPTWLNEFVPFEGFYYSVFPLGSLLAMLPFAALQKIGMITDMPGMFIAALQAGLICWFLLKIAAKYDVSRTRKIVQTLSILFGTFMWTNLSFGSAWQLALGFAVVGELGAIYYTVYERRPLLAGFFFALGFGNRTEILLTAPVIMFLLLRPSGPERAEREPWLSIRSAAAPLAKFSVVPAALGIATLLYNYVRFHSFTDFGYSRIPGVLEEPWYHEGIFSWSYIPSQAWQMLFRSWEAWPAFPYLGPNGFSATILWSSPFLLFLFRTDAPRWLQKKYRKLRERMGERDYLSLYSIFSFRVLRRDHVLKYAAWVAIAILTVLLWTHGNAGGWQFGYRYAMVILPWAFVILLEWAPRRFGIVEATAIGFSFAANTYATWLYNWTTYMKP
jgi:hypothetical protein